MNIDSGLDIEIIDKLKKIFMGFPDIERVILYGSRAKGNYKNGSDIDLTLIGQNLDLNILYRTEDKIDDLLLPHSFDLSLFKDIENKDLIEHINRAGVDFYSKQ